MAVEDGDDNALLNCVVEIDVEIGSAILDICGVTKSSSQIGEFLP